MILSGSQERLKPLLRRGESHLLQSPRFAAAEIMFLRVLEGKAPPQAEGIRKDRGSGSRIGLQRRRLYQGGKAQRIHALLVDGQDVPRGDGLNDTGRQLLPEIRDVDLKTLWSARRRCISPQRVDQLRSAHDPSTIQGQQCEQSTLTARSDGLATAVNAKDERPQDTDLD
jgi:hypothetical protein